VTGVFSQAFWGKPKLRTIQKEGRKKQEQSKVPVFILILFRCKKPNFLRSIEET
jgi:hypothetical protein